jgi:hypothetical protein
MSTTAQQQPEMTISEVVLASVSFVGKLDDGELLTGTPVIDTVTGLTFSDPVVSTAILTINGKTVPVGQAIQFKIVATAIGSYTIPASCATDSSPAQTRRAKLPLIVVADA